MALPVSIALASHNGSRYIREQLDSIAKQTILPAELIVTDDQSTDNTLELVEAFAKDAPFPVRTVRNPARLGYRANFLKAASLCGSEIIAYCDQDDIWLPHKLEKCLAHFSRNDVILTYHNARVVTERLEPIGFLDKVWTAPQTYNLPLSIEPWRYGLGFTLLFRRTLLEFNDFWQLSADINDPEHREAHDQWFCFLASVLGSIAYVGEPLTLYRQHGANTYGCGQSSTGFKALMANVRGTHLAALNGREIGAGKRAIILDRIQYKLPAYQASRAFVAAEGYRKLENSYRARQKIYQSGNIIFRIGNLSTLALRGCYGRKSRWGAGWKALGRDIVRGVVFPPARPANGK